MPTTAAKVTAPVVDVTGVIQRKQRVLVEQENSRSAEDPQHTELKQGGLSCNQRTA